MTSANRRQPSTARGENPRRSDIESSASFTSEQLSRSHSAFYSTFSAVDQDGKPDARERPGISSAFKEPNESDARASFDLLNPHTPSSGVTHVARRDKASQVLGIQHRRSMEPIPASARTSIVSSRSTPAAAPPSPSHVATSPLTSLYVVSGLPKSPQTWTLADPEAVQGLSHSEGAVNRWWRAEVLGSTVSPGVGGGRRKRGNRGKDSDIVKGAGALTKQETAKMLSKALKVRELPVRLTLRLPPLC